MNDDDEDEMAENVVRYLEQIRQTLIDRMKAGEEIDPRAYTAAINMYLGELLWASSVPLATAMKIAANTVKSTYAACDNIQSQGEIHATLQ